MKSFANIDQYFPAIRVQMEARCLSAPPPPLLHFHIFLLPLNSKRRRRRSTLSHPHSTFKRRRRQKNKNKKTFLNPLIKIIGERKRESEAGTQPGIYRFNLCLNFMERWNGGSRTETICQSLELDWHYRNKPGPIST